MLHYLYITREGQPYLGSPIGTSSFVHRFVAIKVAGWVSEIEELSKFTSKHPHCVYRKNSRNVCTRPSKQSHVRDVTLFINTCRYFLMYLISKPETEFSGQVSDL